MYYIFLIPRHFLIEILLSQGVLLKYLRLLKSHVLKTFIFKEASIQSVYPYLLEE